jgi:ABC-2 type transport system permease protein
MRSVLIMAVKDLKLITRDWLGLFFIVGFPILMGVFFGSMYGGVDTGSASLSIALVDEDQSAMSARFADALAATGNVQIERLPRGDALDRVRRGQLVGMIAIPNGFGATAGIMWLESPAIEVGIDPSRKAEAGMLQGMIMQAVGRLMVQRFQDPGSMRPLIQQARQDIADASDIPVAMRPFLLQMMDSLDALMASWQEVRDAQRTSETQESAADVPGFQLARIETIDVTREIPQGSTEALVRQLRSPWDISFPQATLWGVLACAASFAITIVRERKQGTFLRLQVAPVTRGQILAGKATACFLAVLGVILVMVLLGLWLGMRPRNLPLLALAAVCVAVCFAGIMMLMSVIGKSEEAVSGAAWGVNMFMAMFGGAMIPLVFMPTFMKTISHFSPVTWSILSLEGAIWRGFDLPEMLAPCAALVLTGVVCLVIGTVVLSRAAN